MVAIVFAVTGSFALSIATTYQDKPLDVNLSEEWHSATITEIYDSWDDTDVFFTDGSCIVFTNEIYIYEGKNKEKLKLKPGQRLYFQNKMPKSGKRLITYACASQDDTRECVSPSLIINPKLNSFTFNQGFIKGSQQPSDSN